MPVGAELGQRPSAKPGTNLQVSHDLDHFPYAGLFPDCVGRWREAQRRVLQSVGGDCCFHTHSLGTMHVCRVPVCRPMSPWDLQAVYEAPQALTHES